MAEFSDLKNLTLSNIEVRREEYYIDDDGDFV